MSGGIPQIQGDKTVLMASKTGKQPCDEAEGIVARSASERDEVLKRMLKMKPTPRASNGEKPQRPKAKKIDRGH